MPHIQTLSRALEIYEDNTSYMEKCVKQRSKSAAIIRKDRTLAYGDAVDPTSRVDVYHFMFVYTPEYACILWRGNTIVIIELD